MTYNTESTGYYLNIYITKLMFCNSREGGGGSRQWGIAQYLQKNLSKFV